MGLLAKHLYVFIFIIFCLWVHVCEHVSVGTQGSNGHWIPWNWSDRWLWVAQNGY